MEVEGQGNIAGGGGEESEVQSVISSVTDDKGNILQFDNINIHR